MVNRQRAALTTTKATMIVFCTQRIPFGFRMRASIGEERTSAEPTQPQEVGSMRALDRICEDTSDPRCISRPEYSRIRCIPFAISCAICIVVIPLLGGIHTFGAFTGAPEIILTCFAFALGFAVFLSLSSFAIKSTAARSTPRIETIARIAIGRELSKGLVFRAVSARFLGYNCHIGLQSRSVMPAGVSAPRGLLVCINYTTKIHFRAF
jgi:hypothetical protein